jgi:alkanesulfonate monooxygenase SsuD/methylene tetrahydromethanopterin reductase-like flavin-dependent oxidoreductase (luciferase family)
VTEHRTTDKAAAQLVREMVRRAGHELRNALSGVAVNVEVVHSRAERGQPAKEIVSFADRARLQVGVATAVGDGLLSLVNSVLTAAAEGTLKSAPGHGAESQMELMIYGDRRDVVVSDIERLASLIGVSVEQQDHRVILKLLPEGKSHSKD